MFGLNIEFHPAIELAVQVWGYICAIAGVLWIIIKLKAKFEGANDVIEQAKFLPGGSKYIHPMEEEAEYEELSWKAHA